MNSPAVKKEDWNKDASTEGLSKEDLVRAMQAATGEGPGRFLKQFRELSGMSEMEAASRMAIGLHQLAALQNNDFSQLPAPIYVRSYLRRFAEIFEVPVEALLEAYERCEESHEPDVGRVSQKERIQTGGISSKWIMYGVGAVLLALTLWFASSVGVAEWLMSLGDTASEPASQELELPTALPGQPVTEFEAPAE